MRRIFDIRMPKVEWILGGRKFDDDSLSFSAPGAGDPSPGGNPPQDMTGGVSPMKLERADRFQDADELMLVAAPNAIPRQVR